MRRHFPPHHRSLQRLGEFGKASSLCSLFLRSVRIALLQWKTLNLHDDQAGLLPFFIEWSADTVHPSADAPSGCKLLRFELSTPGSTELERICALLDLDVPVSHGEKPQLLARIAGPDGRFMTLAS